MADYKGVMVCTEQKHGKFHRVSFELLAQAQILAKKLGEPVYCSVLGPSNLDLSQLTSRGADEIFMVSDDNAFEYPDVMLTTDNLAQIIEEVKPSVCLFGATSFGRSLAPRIAARFGCGLTADCTGLDIDESGNLIQIRPAFSENILAHILSSARPQMATIRYKEFDEQTPVEGLKSNVKHFDFKDSSVGLIETLREIKQEDFNITDASVVVSAGKGLKTPEDIKLIETLAKALGGVVGGSRPLIDEGFLTKPHQVGYSGNRVKPKLYVACGISGAPQHQAGMKEADIILAINTDPSAPIFNIADYGIVGDLYQVIPSLIEAIEKR